MTEAVETDAAPIGEIAEVEGPVVVIACRTLPPLRQALCARLDSETYVDEWGSRKRITAALFSRAFDHRRRP